MRKLLNYIRGRALIFALLAPLMMLLEVIMDLLQPTLMSRIIDYGVASGDLSYVLRTGGLMLACALIGVIGGVCCSIFASIAATHTAQLLRHTLFEKVQTFSFLELDHFKTSSLITRLTNDVTQVQQIISFGLKGMVRAPLLCIGGFIMALTLSKELTLILAVALPIIICIVAVVLSKSFPLFRGMQEKIDAMNIVMRENLLGMRVVKAFTLEGKQKQRFAKSNDELMQQSMQAQNLTIILMPIVMFIVNLCIIIALWYGGNLAQIGGIETGKIMAFINYLTQIMMSFMMLVMMAINFSRGKVSADRINEVLAMSSSICDPTNPEVLTTGTITFENVSFRYHPHGEYALKNISFQVSPGMRVGIIGGTGSGKSTLIHLIPRLYDVTEGAIYIGDTDVRQLSLPTLRDKIGVVLQESILFLGDIKSNLTFGHGNPTDAAIIAASTDACAAEFIDQKEGGYAHPIEQRGKNLSGGQKQRVSIARTLLRSPEILILDDATSALDMATEAKVLAAIKSRMIGKTTFIVAQRLSAIMDADQILVLDNGELTGIGTHDTLLATNALYRSIACSQLGEEVLSHVTK